MQSTVQSRIPAAVDIQLVVVRTEPVQVLVDTVEDLEVDTALALEQEPGQDMEFVLYQQLDMGLMLEEHRQADCWYIVLCFPYFFLSL